MARHSGSLLACLGSIHSHLEPHHARLAVESGTNTVAGITRRNAIIDAEVMAARDRIEEIKRILAQQGHGELAALFEERFEYGID